MKVVIYLDVQHMFYLLLEPALKAVKYRPVVCEISVHGLVQLHVHHDSARLVLGDQVAQRRKQESEGVRG